MDFDLDDEQRGLIDALTTLLARHAGPQRAREVAAAGGYDEELMGALVEAGYADVREVGAGPLEAVLVTEIVAREAGCAPIGWRALVAPAVLDGDLPAVVVPLDPGAPDAPVRYAAYADAFLAVRGGEVALVEPAAVEREPIESTFGYPFAIVRGADAVGTPVAGATSDTLLRWWRLALAAEMVGLMEAAVSRTVAYVTERHQFGRPLGSLQAIQHRLAELHVRVEGARWLTRYAAYNGAPAEDAAVASTAAVEAAQLVVSETHQLTGAMGLTEEYDLHLWTMRLVALRQECGGLAGHAEAAATARWLDAPATGGEGDSTSAAPSLTT